MRRAAGLTLVALSLHLSPLTLGAQSRSQLTAGARVRVAASPRIGWITGTVASADSARLILRAARGAAQDTVPFTSVEALEVSRGRPWQVRTVVGALGGCVLGGVIGALIGAGYADGGGDTGAGAALGASVGCAAWALLGGAAGALTARERWRAVPIR